MSVELEMQERLQVFHARSERYRLLGYDRAGAAQFVAGMVGVACGPALDVGTGKGVLAVELARTGLSVESVDIDGEEQSLAALLAREAGVEDRLRFLQADAASLPYPDAHFGCAAMMDVLHHLDAPRTVLREMARVVRENGLVVVADFDEEGFSIVGRVHEEDGRLHPRTQTTLEQAQEELCEEGLCCLKRADGFLHHVVVMQKRRRVP